MLSRRILKQSPQGECPSSDPSWSRSNSTNLSLPWETPCPQQEGIKIQTSRSHQLDENYASPFLLSSKVCSLRSFHHEMVLFMTRIKQLDLPSFLSPTQFQFEFHSSNLSFYPFLPSFQPDTGVSSPPWLSPKELLSFIPQHRSIPITVLSPIICNANLASLICGIRRLSFKVVPGITE